MQTYSVCASVLWSGTNFLIRANAFKQAGWSPEYTLTEDYMLGMVLKQQKWHCRYVEEYLAVGEAPEQVRNCFQQRSRWCKVRLSLFDLLPFDVILYRVMACNSDIFQCLYAVWAHLRSYFMQDITACLL